MPTVGKIFISHASADKPFVDKLVRDLAAKSIPVWYDKLDLRIGDSVSGSINSGLTDSKYFAIVLSKASTASTWVREELNAALMKQVAQGGTFILPILIEDCDIPPCSRTDDMLIFELITTQLLKSSSRCGAWTSTPVPQPLRVRSILGRILKCPTWSLFIWTSLMLPCAKAIDESAAP